MQNVYLYPAVFTQKDNVITVHFPDLPLATEGDDWQHAVYMAYDALSLRLYTMERDHDTIPVPTDPLCLKATLTDQQILTLIRVDMREVRAKHSTRAVSKKLGIKKR